MDTHLESARRFFLRVLAWHRPPSALDYANIFGGMAYYHLERKDWVNSIKLCEEALIVLPARAGPQRSSSSSYDFSDPRPPLFLLLLTRAALRHPSL